MYTIVTGAAGGCRGESSFAPQPPQRNAPQDKKTDSAGRRPTNTSKPRHSGLDPESRIVKLQRNAPQKFPLPQQPDMNTLHA
jgi:hypothetical protein